MARSDKRWFAVDVNIHTNTKVIALADALGLDVDTAVGKLTRLYAWAEANLNETGEITGLPPREIADIMRWKKKPSILFEALMQCGFIVEFIEEGKSERQTWIAGWYEMNGKSIEKARKDRERKHGNSTE